MKSKSKLKQNYPTITQLGGYIKNLRRLVKSEDKLWSAFNPSIGYSPVYGYAMTIRSSNYVIHENTGYLDVTTGGEIKNQVWFAELDNNFAISSLKQIIFAPSTLKVKRGVEDAKLFWRNGSWYFTAIMLEKDHTPRARVVLYKYDHETNIASLVEKYEGPDWGKPEKNWMAPPEENPNFDYIYGPTGFIKDGYVVQKLHNSSEIGSIRGNTNLLPIEDGYLAVVHQLYTKKLSYYSPRIFSYAEGTQKFYTHQFAKYDYKGILVALTPEFQFEKNGIEFAAGLVQHGDDFIVSYGSEDVSSHLAFIPCKTVFAALKEI